MTEWRGKVSSGASELWTGRRDKRRKGSMPHKDGETDTPNGSRTRTSYRQALTTNNMADGLVAMDRIEWNPTS